VSGVVHVRLELSEVAYVLAMVLVGVLAYRGERLALAGLVLLSLVWFRIDALWEGGVLISFNHEHGLTSADLVGVAGLGFAGWAWWRKRRR
jgi:hypothetical protein